MGNQGFNSLYFTAANLAVESADKGNTARQEFQMNQWTFDNVKDEVALLAPGQLTVTEGEFAATLLNIPVRINEDMKDTQIVLLEKKQTLDKSGHFVVRL